MYHLKEWKLTRLPKTRVWRTEAVQKQILKRDPQDRRKLMQKLQRYSANGFAEYLGVAIQREQDGVFRIGSKSDLFRILGFFEDGTEDFMACEAFLKKGQELTRAQQQKIGSIAVAKAENRYRKAESDG